MLMTMTDHTVDRSLNGAGMALPVNMPVVLTITPKLAEQWLTAYEYKDQRPLNQGHVDMLAGEMRRGKFSQNTMIRFAELRGQRMLIDGQHRLWAIVESEQPQSFVVLVSTVVSDEELAWLYGNIDINRRRTTNELYGPLHLADEFGFSAARDVNNLSSAISFLSSGCAYHRKDATKLNRDDLLTYMRVFAPYMRQYIQVMAGCDHTIRTTHVGVRAPTLAVVLLTLRYSAPRAKERGDPDVIDFWRGATLDDGLAIGDPRKLAYKHLLTTRMQSSRSIEGFTAVSAAYSSRFLAACFNAYMQGRQLKQGKVIDVRAPLQLYGLVGDADTWLRGTT